MEKVLVVEGGDELRLLVRADWLWSTRADAFFMQTKRAEGREGLGQNHKTAVLDAKKKKKIKFFFRAELPFCQMFSLSFGSL